MTLKTETRSVQNFSELVLKGIGELIVEIDPEGPESLTVEADATVLERLESRVENGCLTLSFKVPFIDWLGWGLEWLFTWDKTLRYHLKARQLKRIEIDGAADVKAGHLQAEAFQLALNGAGKIRLDELQAGVCRISLSGSGDVRVGKMKVDSLSCLLSGAGNIEMSGTADDLDARLSGAGSLRAAGLQSQTAHVILSGVGSAEVAVAQSLNAALSGAGSVRYHGSPQVVQNVSGMGRVSQAS